VSSGPLIFVVDDEADLRLMLADYLGGYDLRVEGFADPPALRAALERTRPDLVILDVNMPGEDGFAALATLRTGPMADLPVIMLTAAGSTTLRIAGLNGGADDYVVKPFDLRELLARIRAVLARTKPAPAASAQLVPRLLAFGGCSIDLDGRRLQGPDGREVALTAFEFDLVVALAERPRRVLGRASIEGDSRSEISDRRLDVRVTRLRGKLAGVGCGDVIRTVRGAGYVYEPPVAGQ
jgi:two-component system OmpR family response regulator